MVSFLQKEKMFFLRTRSECDSIAENFILSIIELQRGMTHNTKTTEGQGKAFYKDMRFWLIIVMLSAFLVFILVRFPG